MAVMGAEAKLASKLVQLHCPEAGVRHSLLLCSVACQVQNLIVSREGPLTRFGDAQIMKLNWHRLRPLWGVTCRSVTLKYFDSKFVFACYSFT